MVPRVVTFVTNRVECAGHGPVRYSGSSSSISPRWL